MKLNMKFTVLTVAVTVVSLSVLSAILFHNMEDNVIRESRNYVEYKASQSQSHVVTCVDSLNMSTQFFLADDQMVDMLNCSVEGEALTTQEILDFQSADVTNLERLVNSNPLLYAVRIYSVNDNVQEMMPILYKSSRMDNLAWAADEEIYGWHFGYFDTAFSSLIVNQDDALVGLVTPIFDYQNGEIGIIEASMKMETMFPCLYESIDGEWYFLVTDEGEYLFGTDKPEDANAYAEYLMEKWGEGTESASYFTKRNGRSIAVTYLPLQEIGITVVGVKDITSNIGNVYRIRNIFVAVMIGVLFLLSYMVNWQIKRMLRQFYTILAAVHEVQDGDLTVRLTVESSDEMGELATQMNIMFDRIQKLMEENINREILVKNSEIRALQNQINAHFIYNVLESIKMMAEIDEKYEIADSITSLGRLLRYSMKWVSGNVRLREELEYIKNYLVLINLRYDFKVYLSLGLPDALMEQEIPKMSLQPIVENAILHGIEPLSEDATIYIKGWMEAEDCVIEVTDAGQGMDEEELQRLRMKIAGKIETTGGKGNGIGLKNVQDRIQMTFGSDYGLCVSSKKGCYTKVAVRLPRKPSLPGL